MRDSPLSWRDVAWLLSFPFLMSIGQVLFRSSAMQAAGQPIGSMLRILLGLPSFAVAVVLYGACTLLWVWLLTRYPLAVAYPFAALAVVIVPVLDMLVFRQPLTGTYWLGLALILGGTFVIVLAQ